MHVCFKNRLGANRLPLRFLERRPQVSGHEQGIPLVNVVQEDVEPSSLELCWRDSLTAYVLELLGLLDI